MTAPQPIVALIAAAGVGARASGSMAGEAIRPKQYRLLANRTMLEHTVRAFNDTARVDAIVVLVSEGDGWIDRVQLGADASLIRCGGETRAHTVLNALKELRRRYKENAWILVHDAARCCITPALIDSLIDACVNDAVGGLLAVPASDTLKRASESSIESEGARSGETMDRRTIWQAQTPQMFRLGALHDALHHVDLSTVTDEASAMELAGHAPKLVLGARSNLKVTYPEDFIVAEAILCHAAQSRPG
jgi:2-C-methyl-D-erythritol 4-phosphate cytidylyltransferase